MPERTLHRTCIVCPRGCSLDITVRGEQILVEGNDCSRGEDHGLDEATSPMRILTTTVRTTDAVRPRLPVRSSAPVPLEHIRRLMREINSIVVSAPVRCGDTVVVGLGAVLSQTVPDESDPSVAADREPDSTPAVGVSLVATDDLPVRTRSDESPAIHHGPGPNSDGTIREG